MHADRTYFRYSLGDFFAIGDCHEMGIDLSWIVTETVLSFVGEGNRLLIEFSHRAIIDFLEKNNIEYFASAEDSPERQKHMNWLGKVKAVFFYVPTYILFSTEDSQVLQEVIAKFWDEHFIFRLSTMKTAPLSEEATGIRTGNIERYLYETGLKSGFIMWESENHKNLNIITGRHHPGALMEIIAPIVKQKNLDCDIYEEDLSPNENRILELIACR